MRYDLVIVDGPHAGQRLLPDSNPVSIGRGPSAMAAFPEDTFLSGMHLTAQAAAQGVLLTDMRSTNGSFLNGQRITQAVASLGDTIAIGSLTMRVVAEQPAPTVSDPLQTVVSPAASPATIATSLSKLDQILDVMSQAKEPLFCLLDAAADDMILSLLAVAKDQVQMQCLYDGDSAVNLARWAPYLIRLQPNSPLLRVLIEKGWGKGWASYLTTTSPFEEVRKHFRKFLMVQIEQGKEVYFRFYDPRVMRDFLPTANNAELTIFFGPVSEWIIEGPEGEELLKIRNSPAGISILPIRVTSVGSSETHSSAS